MLKVSCARTIIWEHALKFWKCRREATRVHFVKLAASPRIGNQPDRQGLLLDQQRPNRMHSQYGLLLHGFYRHELYIWSASGLAEGCGIGRIVLLALLHKRLDRLRRDQLHIMA